MDVLFLSISIGAGHLKAAEAVKETIEKNFPGSRTMVVDTLKYINPVVDKVIVGSYLNTLKSTPAIYRKLYKLSDSGSNLNDFSNTVNKLLSFKLKRLIDQFNPSIIVCTHPFPLQMISSLIKKKKIKIPSVAILTDFVVHHSWLHNNIDAFIVANDYMKYQMIRKGINENIIHSYGIPVSEKFLQNKPKSAILEEFKLQNKLTFLIMGGSLGFGEIKDIFISLINNEKDLQIIVITGKNTKLKKQLEKYASKSTKKIKILSYTSRISSFMDISDFIITKPGGMTISESLIKELPILIISPIPGQEELNSQFLVNSGAGIRINDGEELESIFYHVIDNPLRVTHMKEMASNLARPYATKNILDLLVSLTTKNKHSK